jgi:hypothetical protein
MAGSGCGGRPHPRRGAGGIGARPVIPRLPLPLRRRKGQDPGRLQGSNLLPSVRCSCSITGPLLSLQLRKMSQLSGRAYQRLTGKVCSHCTVACAALSAHVVTRRVTVTCGGEHEGRRGPRGTHGYMRPLRKKPPLPLTSRVLVIQSQPLNSQRPPSAAVNVGWHRRRCLSSQDSGRTEAPSGASHKTAQRRSLPHASGAAPLGCGGKTLLASSSA